MSNKFTEDDQKFLTECGIAADKVESTFSADRLALARRISKHQSPAQVKVNPQAAKHQLIHLAMQKLHNAPAEQLNRCRRPSGNFRAWFATAAEAVAFAENPVNTAYHVDMAVKCQQPGCGGWHLSQPNWPDAQASKNAQIN
jgi:hypothetical protein